MSAVGAVINGLGSKRQDGFLSMGRAVQFLAARTSISALVVANNSFEARIDCSWRVHSAAEAGGCGDGGGGGEKEEEEEEEEEGRCFLLHQGNAPMAEKQNRNRFKKGGSCLCRCSLPFQLSTQNKRFVKFERR